MMRRSSHDAARLAEQWDSIVNGRAPDGGEIGRDLLATVSAIHTGDDAPLPDAGYARRLEESLVATGAGLNVGRRSHRSRANLSPGVGLLRRVLVASLVSLAIVVGITMMRGGELPDRHQSGDMIPAAVVASPTVDSAAPGSASLNGAQPIPGCTTGPREPGTVDRLLAEGAPSTYGLLPRDDGDVNHGATLLDGDAYVDHMTTGPVDQSTIDAINATLGQLDACRYYAFTSDRKADKDGRYFANFSDSYFSLQYSSPEYDGMSFDRWVGWIPRWSETPSVEQAWETVDRRVLASVAFGQPLLPGARTVMIFVRVNDRWLVDEVARTMLFDSLSDAPWAPEPDSPVEILPIVIYDTAAPRPQGVDGNYTTMGLYAPDYPFIADGGLSIRLVNLGTKTHRFAIPTLSIDETLAPGAVVDLPIIAPIGSYDWSIYEEGIDGPTAANSFALVAPGTSRGLG